MHLKQDMLSRDIIFVYLPIEVRKTATLKNKVIGDFILEKCLMENFFNRVK